MKTLNFAKHCAIGLLFGMPHFSAFAADPAAGIVGKNDWLFYRHEITEANDTPATNVSIDLISRLNRELSRNGTAMIVSMVPIKMRVYAEHLPGDIRLNDYMTNNYSRMLKQLQNAKVNVADLNSAFMGSPLRTSDNPFFLRLDTHWAPSGSMLAAETIRAAIDNQPDLKKALDSSSEQKFNMSWDARKVGIRSARDLVAQLPKGAVAPGQEEMQQFTISKPPVKGSLVDDSKGPDITLMGSSYSHAWTKFPDALRYTLQRDILAISVGANQGTWVGMESYLSNEAFQTQRPKLIVWEMPERDMRATPNYKFREARYVVDNMDWLVRSAAWAQSKCVPAASSAKVEPLSLAAQGDPKGIASTVNDFVEISFSSPAGTLDYVSARFGSGGSKQLNIELSGPAGATQQFTQRTSGDDELQNLRIALPADGKTYTKMRIKPGKSSSFSLSNVELCRLPEDLLK